MAEYRFRSPKSLQFRKLPEDFRRRCLAWSAEHRPTPFTPAHPAQIAMP
jgi:hypothetical protein